MSATLDGERPARFLDAPRLSSEGRSYPVTVSHFPARRDETLELQVRRAVQQALADHPGDLLVFLPGQREIARVQAGLQESLDGNVEVLALHGELPVEQQARVLQMASDGRRRVVLATNVAESSVTLPGVRVVIDSGRAREPRYDPNSGFTRLDVVSIAQRRPTSAPVAPVAWPKAWPAAVAAVAAIGAAAPCRDRPGGTGRTGAGTGRVGQQRPALPRPATGRPDGCGARTAATPGCTVGLGRDHRTRAPCTGAGYAPADGGDAAGSARCPRAGAGHRSGRPAGSARPAAPGGDALASRWRALAAFRNGRIPGDANRSGLAAIDAAAGHWRRRLRCEATPPASIEAHELGDLLAHAFPDRIGVQHPSDPLRYLLANGRSARLHELSDLRGEPWLVASELRFEARDALLLRAAPVDEGQLRKAWPERFVTEDVVRWDSERRAWWRCARPVSTGSCWTAARPAGSIRSTPRRR